MSHLGRVTLRRVEPEDYPAIQRWQNDPELARWMDYDRLFSLDDIQASEARAVKEGHPFVICVDGNAIGRIGLNNVRRRDRMASLYVFVGERSEWGKGYGLDAMFQVMAFGFDRLNLRKIELWMLEGNERAIRMYKTAGFVEDARIPDRSYMDGTYVAHIVMSADREGYERALAAHTS